MPICRLAILYALFGAAATLANLVTQAALRALLPAVSGPLGPAYWAALVAGTGAGLAVKYLLDKRWIFQDTSTGLAIHTRKFTLYALMGLATTAIFWSMQTGFYMASQSEAMLYIGGALGLAIGYVLKYHLDRRFVFGARPEPA